jgi:hypothetical protein
LEALQEFLGLGGTGLDKQQPKPFSATQRPLQSLVLGFGVGGNVLGRFCQGHNLG